MHATPTDETLIVCRAFAKFPAESLDQINEIFSQLPGDIPVRQRTEIVAAFVANVIGEAFVDTFMAVPQEKRTLACQVLVELVATAIKSRIDWDWVATSIMTKEGLN